MQKMMCILLLKQFFTAEKDASDRIIAALLNQAGRPRAFFSRTIRTSKQNHLPIEKVAYAIVEGICKWRYYLIRCHLTLLTDQEFVTFTF